MPAAKAVPFAVPVKPFPEFKWRWASYEPTEGLNAPSINLAVLRAIRKHEGKRFSDTVLHKDLEVLDKELRHVLGRLHLARKTAQRNLFRNSRQYWVAFGLLKSSTTIELTPFGREVADGSVSMPDFAAATIKTLKLPNPLLEESATISQWKSAGIELSPLELILRILLAIEEKDAGVAHITGEELRVVAIPLTITSVAPKRIAEAVLMFRDGTLKGVSKWPDCAPGDNDPRMVREFLRFLYHYGYLDIDSFAARITDKTQFRLAQSSRGLVSAVLEMPTVASISGAASVAAAFEPFQQARREKTTSSRLARPQQRKFQREVMKSCGGHCVLTGEAIAEVLVAAHIWPVEENGSDHHSNGLALRSDVHILYDNHDIRICGNGDVILSARLLSHPTYSSLPKSITIPKSVNIEALNHRNSYL